MPAGALICDFWNAGTRLKDELAKIKPRRRATARVVTVTGGNRLWRNSYPLCGWSDIPGAALRLDAAAVSQSKLGAD